MAIEHAPMTQMAFEQSPMVDGTVASDGNGMEEFGGRLAPRNDGDDEAAMSVHSGGDAEIQPSRSDMPSEVAGTPEPHDRTGAEDDVDIAGERQIGVQEAVCHAFNMARSKQMILL